LKLALVCVLVALCLAVSFSYAEELEFNHGLSMFHDLKYGPDFKHFEYVNPVAPPGGTITLSTDFNIRNFAGAFDNNNGGPPGMVYVYDTLIVRSGDELGGFYGRLAESMAVSNDGRILAFRLRSEARFHDGTPITSKDVKFTLDWALSTVQGGLYLGWIESVEAVNDHEVRLHLKEPLNDSNLRLLAYEPRVLPEHHWRGKNPSKATPAFPLGSGPYRVASWDQGYIRFQRVADYWGRDLPVNRGLYNFDELHFDVYRDATVAREALRKGLFDSYEENDIRHWVSSYDVPVARAGYLRKGERTRGYVIGPSRVIAFNSRRPPLDDVRVREALSMAFDFDWQNRVLYSGAYRRATSYFADTLFGATGLPTPEELILLEPMRKSLDRRVFEEPFALPDSNGRGRNRDALLRASQLLIEAGWRVEGGVLRNASGDAFDLEFLSTHIDERRVLLPYIDTLRILGINASIKLVESAQYINLRRKRDFDAMLRSHDMLLPPIAELRVFFSSAAAQQPLGWNIAGINDPIVDALIDLATQTTTFSAMTTACRVLDRVLLRGYYHIPLEVVSNKRIIYWDRFGQPETDKIATFQSPGFDSWWYDPEKAARIGGSPTEW
jgi:microcin C transport system substrate-binding protein